MKRLLPRLSTHCIISIYQKQQVPHIGYNSGNLGGHTGGYQSNTAVGDFTLRYMNDETDYNSILGAFAGEGLVSSNCTLLGYQAGEFMTTACDNTVCIGKDSGSNFNTGNSNKTQG